jgi:uncharacterized protein
MVISPASTATALGPTATTERMELLDILRGFALFGILLFNFHGSVGTNWPSTDAAILRGIDWLIESSFYPLFSFLFGLGFALQLNRAAERGTRASVIYARRLCVLLLIGTVHAVIIRSGDILVNYALLGFVLIPVAKFPTRALFLVILSLASILTINNAARRASVDVWRGTSVLDEGLRAEHERTFRNREMREDERRDGFLSSVEIRWHKFGRKIHNHTDWYWVITEDVVMLFVIGLYAGRRRLFESAAGHRPRTIVVAVGGLTAAVGGNLYAAYGSGSSPELANLGSMAANYGMTVFYVAALTAIVTGRGAGARALRVFAPVGRMALTNYLMQSVVMTLLFDAYGFGMPTPDASMWLLLDVVFFFAAQVSFSRWWLARYQFGPAEWLWRSGTYGSLQPMRRLPLIPAASPTPTLAAS